ncbi:BON domain-containing protein [Agrobacterium rhizogenes]|nr:BON domain-containing protein [Rhizobium rhizogenes]NTJ77656.1 BON domain-containing protein [Rhizobium rhizogenes]
MTEIGNKASEKGSPDRGDTRTLRAFDQAAGGSGDIVAARGENASAATRPDHGTDDARCEDSAECDAHRQQAANKISARIADLRTMPGSAPIRERTDAEIRAEITRKLEADGLLDAAGIFVTVSHGRVIIEGSVDNHEAKQRAEAISRQASGITGHDTNLAVRTRR